MEPIQIKELPNPIKFGVAGCIFFGGFMHFLGLIAAWRNGWSLPWQCLPFFFSAIILYPASAVMIVKNMSLGYLIAFALPCIGGLFIFIGFIWPKSHFLMILVGTHEREITLMGFLQIISESFAVAGVAIIAYLSYLQQK